jgi:hypothetical protein
MLFAVLRARSGDSDCADMPAIKQRTGPRRQSIATRPGAS